MSSVDNIMNKVTKVVGKDNVNKAKKMLNKEAKKATDKIGDAVGKKIKVDGDKIEKELNKYVDKYIK